MKDQISIFIYCQALGWDKMQQHRFLSGLAENRAKIHPLLNSPCTALPSIVAGKYPNEHEIFAWYLYGPDRSPFTGFRFLANLPLGVRKSGWFRKAVDRVVQKSHGIMGRFDTFSIPMRFLPLFDFVEKRNLLEPGAFDETKTIFDRFVDAQMNYFCSRWEYTDPENADSLEELLEIGEITAAFCLFCSTEYVFARHGCWSSAARSRTAWLDHRIRRLYETAARNYRRVSLLVFSDAGMMNVNSSLNIPLRLQGTGYKYGKDYVAFYEPVMARFWFFSDKCRDDLTEALSKLPSVRILTREDLQNEHCWFPDNRYGELVLVANPDTVLYPNFISSREPLAAYGYATDNPGIAGGFVCNAADLEPPDSLPRLYELMLDAIPELKYGVLETA